VCKRELNQYRTRYKDTRISPDKAMSFAFGRNLVTEDKALVTADDEKIENMGTIELVFNEATVSYTKGRRTRYHTLDPNVFDEKTKKGMIKHAVRGIIRPVGKESDIIGNHVSTGPKIRCIFKYRSKDWLQAEGHIPYTAGHSVVEDNTVILTDVPIDVVKSDANAQDEINNIGVATLPPVCIDLTSD
jgi:hypothetical protein